VSYTPAIPLSGLAGLRFLERTGEAQRAAHASAPEIQRDIAYFKENIGNVTNAEELVNDRRLLTVVLGSYGLGDEIDKKAFVQRILDDGVDDPNALGSRLNNESYKQMARDLRLDTNFPRTSFDSIQDKIVSNYLDQSFEISVGEQSESLRLALDFKRRAGDVGERGWLSAFRHRISGYRQAEGAVRRTRLPAVRYARAVRNLFRSGEDGQAGIALSGARRSE